MVGMYHKSYRSRMCVEDLGSSHKATGHQATSPQSLCSRFLLAHYSITHHRAIKDLSDESRMTNTFSSSKICCLAATLSLQFGILTLFSVTWPHLSVSLSTIHLFSCPPQSSKLFVQVSKFAVVTGTLGTLPWRISTDHISQSRHCSSDNCISLVPKMAAQAQPTPPPSFKLVLVGDGGTGKVSERCQSRLDWSIIGFSTIYRCETTPWMSADLDISQF